MTDEPQPALTTAPGEPELDEGLIVEGPVSVRMTHPNLYRTVMMLGILNVALGLNFWILSPTFLIYDMPNQLWGSIFLALGTCKLVFLNVWRRLRGVRAVMACAVAFYLFLGAGTMQPFFEGQGSLQLPLMYLGVAVLQIPVLVEPFINPWTSRR